MQLLTTYLMHKLSFGKVHTFFWNTLYIVGPSVLEPYLKIDQDMAVKIAKRNIFVGTGMIEIRFVHLPTYPALVS